MPVDASIPLQAGQNIPQFGPDLKQIITMQALGLRMQQAQQEQQGQNALKQLYGDPANVDPNGNLTPQAMTRLMQQSPNVGMDYRQSVVKGQQAQMQTQLAGAKVRDEHRQWLVDTVAEPAVVKYDEVLKATGSQEAAQREAQKVYSESLDGVKSDGRLTPQETRMLSPQFDAQRARANVMGMKGMQDEARKDRAENREEVGLTERVQHDRAIEDSAKLRAERTGGEKLGPSKEIAVVDKDGNVVSRFAARESSMGPGWIHSDTGEPVKVPPGGKIDVGQAAGAVIGTRENVYIGRQLEGGITATADLENISKMPMSVSSGVFGGRKQGPGLMDATKEVLTNSITSQDVQLYNAANAGIQRALAVIETMGLAPSGAFTDAFNSQTLKEGDSQLTRLYKLANARQIVENGMKVVSANPRLAPEQRKLAEELVQRVQTAIPWQTADVIKLQTSDDPGATLHNLGVGKTGKGEAQSGGASAPLPKKANDGIFTPADEKEYNTLPSGATYRMPGDPPDKVRMKP